jgi:hypothetical protein
MRPAKAHPVTVAGKKDRDAPVAIAWVLRRQLGHSRQRRRILLSLHRPVC